MKHYIFWLSILITVSLMASCRKDHGSTPKTAASGINCDTVSCPITADFYGAGLMNQECWFMEATYFEGKTGSKYFILLASSRDGIGEGLQFSISRSANLKDTIWLVRSNVDHSHPNIAQAWYSYNEGASIAGGFDFAEDAPPTYEDYLLIDYFNEDTTLLEGRFRLRFTERNVSGFVEGHAPDSMRIDCGRFRVEQYN